MLSSDPKNVSYFVHLCICMKKKLCRIHETKYLVYFLSEDQSDDAEISSKYALFMYDQTTYCECLVIAP